MSTNIIPISVNGNLSDAAGNITISTGGGGSSTGINGLNGTTNIGIGGTLLNDSFISTAGFNLIISGSNTFSEDALLIAQTSNSSGVAFKATGGTAIYASTSAGGSVAAIQIDVNSGTRGIVASGYDNFLMQAERHTTTTTNTMQSVLKLVSKTNVPLAGFGPGIEFHSDGTAGEIHTHDIRSRLIDPTNATSTAQFEIWGVNNNSVTRKLAITGPGALILDGYNTLPTYATEAAAVSAGLPQNTVYKTSTGELRIKL